MSILGSCDCNNIQATWHTVDYARVPRACQCEYCREKQAAYVSKSGTRIDVSIRNKHYYGTAQQGSRSATFHECTHCEQVVLVTAEIDGALYGALNATHLVNKFGFPDPIKTDFSALSAAEKQQRWRQNWCSPVALPSGNG